jgi:hypothetical protein
MLRACFRLCRGHGTCRGGGRYNRNTQLQAFGHVDQSNLGPATPGPGLSNYRAASGSSQAKSCRCGLFFTGVVAAATAPIKEEAGAARTISCKLSAMSADPGPLAPGPCLAAPGAHPGAPGQSPGLPHLVGAGHVGQPGPGNSRTGRGTSRTASGRIQAKSKAGAHPLGLPGSGCLAWSLFSLSRPQHRGASRRNWQRQLQAVGRVSPPGNFRTGPGNSRTESKSSREGTGFPHLDENSLELGAWHGLFFKAVVGAAA